MKPEEAQKLARQNSKRMEAIYDEIRKSASRGNYQVYLNTGMASKAEQEVLTDKGYKCFYETSETDGGQFLVISWQG